jgi:hypothetical protein
MNAMLILAGVVFLAGFVIFTKGEVEARRLPLPARMQRGLGTYNELAGALTMSAALVLALVALGMGALG